MDCGRDRKEGGVIAMEESSITSTSGEQVDSPIKAKVHIDASQGPAIHPILSFLDQEIYGTKDRTSPSSFRTSAVPHQPSKPLSHKSAITSTGIHPHESHATGYQYIDRSHPELEH